MSDPHAQPGRSAMSFFALTFAFTWSLQVPAVLAQRGWLAGAPEQYLPLAALGIFGPLAAATILTARGAGRPGLKALYGRLFAWRVGWRWYALALLVPGLLLTLGLGALGQAGYDGDVWLFPPPADRLMVVPLICVAEEVGWRGYALPALERRYGALAAAGILGVVWTAWHVPMFLGLGIPMTTLPVMLLFFVGGSLYFTWIHQRTGGSLLLLSLAHAGAHLFNSHLALPDDTLPSLVHAIVYAALGLGAVYFDRAAFGLRLPSLRSLVPARLR